MRCCASTKAKWWRYWLLRLSWLLVLLLGAATPQAQPGSAVVSEFKLSREAEGLYLTTQLRLTLSSAMREALQKGVPLYFVASAQVVRERWYWRDEVLVQTNRYLRLAYQPLTRRWRVNASSSPIVASGLGVSLNQQHESLEDAVAAMGRFAHWQIADADTAGRIDGQLVQFSFDIDIKQLPRPFLIGQSGKAEWTLSVSHLEAVPAKAP